MAEQADIEFIGAPIGDWRDGYREAVARYVAQRGKFVDEVYYRGPYGPWQSRADDDYDDLATHYGWADYDHLDQREGRGQCRVVSVDLSTMREQTLSEFIDTDADNLMQVGTEFKATCACGAYTNRWLRWEGSASDMLHSILGTGGER